MTSNTYDDVDFMLRWSAADGAAMILEDVAALNRIFQLFPRPRFRECGVIFSRAKTWACPDSGIAWLAPTREPGLIAN